MDLSRMQELLSLYGHGDAIATARGRRPAFVKLAPRDAGDGLRDIFFEDPRTFSPTPGPKGEIRDWGVYPYTQPSDPHYKDETNNSPEFGAMTEMMRKMQYQMDYMSMKEGTPEEQFVRVFMERKKEQLAKIDLHDLDKQDVILKISLAFLNDATGQPRVWRRVRVSAGIKLSAFQDKVVAPVMGWVRNLHAYTFNDFRDGSLYGPEGMSSVDMCHLALRLAMISYLMTNTCWHICSAKRAINSDTCTISAINGTTIFKSSASCPWTTPMEWLKLLMGGACAPEKICKVASIMISF
ncbi:hypothetical protein HGRIS_003358 [Hohenbuehelia grisea]|uniref:Uncharacterized protein n=1 Tax=Hohenbuehelia grisea TaxID=104357 RepID=A0ABR3JFT1_9AGAR